MRACRHKEPQSKKPQHLTWARDENIHSAIGRDVLSIGTVLAKTKASTQTMAIAMKGSDGGASTINFIARGDLSDQLGVAQSRSGEVSAETERSCYPCCRLSQLGATFSRSVPPWWSLGRRPLAMLRSLPRRSCCPCCVPRPLGDTSSATPGASSL